MKNLFLSLILTLTLFGCGSDMNTASNDTGDTGSAVFSLKWETSQNSNDMSLRALSLSKGEAISELSYAPQIDCSALGVLTVTANVYDSSNTYLINGGPWDCTAHSGTITNVPAGDSRKLTIYGKDSSDRIIYRRQVTGVTITANQTTNAGQVTMSTVAPDTTAPTDGTLSATAGSSQVSLSWSNFSDSGGIDYYKLVYSTSSTPSSCSAGTQIYLGSGTSYTHTGRTSGTTYYYVVTAVNSYGESSESSEMSATPTAPSISAPDLGDAVDNTSLSWITGGYAYWFKQSVVYYSGGYAAQSGYIGNSQDTYILTTVTGPGTLKFYWKVSCSYSDDLYFYIDGAQQSAIDGEVDWTQKVYAIPSGSHTLKWAFTRSSYSSPSGSNAGWLDKVEFTQQ